ncbi:hypothetical protein DITRI_Ditri03aG0185300 [Diplodiscus trichospermus]
MSDGQRCLHCARNAWQRLGNMNPDAAMEQYVALLSSRVPGWMEDDSAGEHKFESADRGVPGAMASDINSFPDQQTSFTQERNAELNSTGKGGDMTESTSFEKQSKSSSALMFLLQGQNSKPITLANFLLLNPNLGHVTRDE